MSIISGFQMSSKDMEIQQVAREISQLTKRLVALSGAAYQEEGIPSELQEQLLHFEKENDELNNRLARLTDEHNEALAQLQNTTMQRDEAVVKLCHARKVIRDLVDERPDIATIAKPVPQEDIDYVLQEGSPSTDSDRTVRARGGIGQGASFPSTSGASARSPQQLQPSHYPMSPPSSNPGLASTLSPRSSDASGKGKRPLSLSASMSSVEPIRRGQPSRRPIEPSASTLASPEPHSDLTIHFTKPPGTSFLTGSTFKTDVLVRALKLDNTKEDAVRRLIEKNPTFSTRIAFLETPVGPVVCLSKPMFADGKEIPRSYLIDWNATENDLHKMVERYIDGYIEDGRRAFHFCVFVHPKGVPEGFWVYIGAHTLKWAQLHDIWKTLEAESQRSLVNKLSERLEHLDKEFDVKVNIVRMLDSGELAQLSLRLIPEDQQVSEEFARKVLGNR